MKLKMMMALEPQKSFEAVLSNSNSNSNIERFNAENDHLIILDIKKIIIIIMN